MRPRIILIITLVVVKLNISVFPLFSQGKYNTWLPVETKGVYGGVARTIAIDPNNSNKIYVGLKGGGIYTTVTQPLFWSPILTSLSNYNILALKIHTDQSNLIYAGTEDGLYKSTNEGSSWEWIYFGGQINDIAIDTSKSKRIYIAVGQLYGEQTPKKGLWWSEDDGNTWSHNTFSHNNQIVDVFTCKIIYYSDYNRPEADVSKAIYIGTSKGIWISFDGNSWLDSMHQNDLWTNPVYALAIHPSKAQYIYAGLDHGVIYSKDFGKTGINGMPDSWFQDCRSLRNIRVTCLTIDENFIFAGTWGKGIFKNNALFAATNDTIWDTLNIDAKYIYQIEFDPSNHNTLYAATSMGVYKTTDAGNNWSPINEGISCTKINQFFIPCSSQQSTYFLAKELGGYKTNNIDGSWDEIQGLPKHELLSFLVHPVNYNFWYAGFKEYDKVFISDNAGRSWYQRDLGEICDVNIFAPVANSPYDLPEVYIGTSDSLWKAEGSVIAKKIVGVGNIISLSVKNNNNIDTIYVGTTNNGLWKASEDGNIINKLENGMRPDATINNISVEKFGDYNLIVGTDYGLRVSRNSGLSFEQPSDYYLRSNAIKNFHPSSLDTMPSYASVQNYGIVRSFSLLENWEELNRGREAFADLFKNLIIHPDSQKVLYATTEGGQIYRMQTEPKIRISPDPLDFDGQRVNQTAKKSITIHNEGEWPLKIYNYTIEPDSLSDIFDIALPETGVVTWPGKQKHSVISVGFHPKDTLTYRATVFLSSNAHNPDQNSFELTGKGTAPVIDIDKDSLKFNEVLVDDSLTLSFKMKNTGSDTLNFNIEFMPNTGVFKAVPDSGILLPRSDSIKIDVIFCPDEDIFYEDNLMVVSQYGSFFYGESLVYLSGKGFKGKKIDIIPDSLIFPPTRPEAAETLKFVIANVGSEGVQIDSLRVSEPFHAADTSFYLDRGDSSEIGVIFLSYKTSIFKDTLKVFSEARGDSALYLEATCVTGPIIRITPASIDFGTVLMCDTLAIDLNIKNVGDAILTIDSAKYDRSQFITIDPPNPLNIFLGTDKDTILNIFWIPQEAMVLNDTIDFITNSQAGNTKIPLSGISESPAFNWPDTVNFYEVRHHTSDTIDFDVPYIGGNETLNFDIKKSGPDKDKFFVECQRYSVEKDSAAHVRVIFSPIELGRHLAYLDIFSETIFFGNRHVVLTGKSIIESIIKINPPRFNFGKIKVGECNSKRFFITNQGAETLIIKGYWFEPDYGDSVYTVQFSDRTIPPGEQDTLTVTFCPDTIRHYPTVLHLETNPALGGSSIVLDGEGIGPMPGADLKPPHIIYQWQDLDSLHRGETTTITAYVTDSLSGVNSVVVRFREAGEDSFIREIDLIRQIDTTQYTGNIPGDLITMRGFEYYIEATDKAGNRIRHPEKYYHSARVYVNGYESESKPDPQPFGSLENSYRMISFPFKLYPDDTKKIMQNIMEEEYDSCYWKFAEYCGNEDANKQYRFLNDPAISPIIPGKGFWLLISHKRVKLRTDSTLAITLYTNRPYLIELKKGWNIFGNPFNFTVSLSQIIWKGNDSVEVRSYHGAWNKNLYDHVTEIFPWEGYAIKTQEQDTLLIYPSPELVPDSSKSIMFQPSMDWGVQLIAKCGKAMDADNWIGVSSSSQVGYDRLDISEPPPVGKFVSIAFPHWDWQQRSANYSTDFRPQFYEGNYWDFQVTSNIPDSVVNIHFRNINQIPSLFKLYLIDKDLKNVQQINQQAKYSFITAAQNTIRNFRVIIGSEAFFEQSNLGVKRLPLAYKLYDIFPNPFNSNASIYFTLPEESEVTLEILNVLGQRVRTLLNNEHKKAGYHLVIWDGTDDSNNRISAGIYLCIIKTKNFKLMKKMSLIK